MYSQRAVSAQTRPLVQTAISAFPETLLGLISAFPETLPETRWEEIRASKEDKAQEGGESRPQSFAQSENSFSAFSQTCSLILIKSLATSCSHVLIGTYSLLKQNLEKLFLEESCWGSHSTKGFVGMHSYTLSKLEWALILRPFTPLYWKCTWGFISPLVCWDDTLRSFLHLRILTQCHSYLQQYLSFLDSWDSQPDSWPD